MTPTERALALFPAHEFPYWMRLRVAQAIAAAVEAERAACALLAAENATLRLRLEAGGASRLVDRAAGEP